MSGEDNSGRDSRGGKGFLRGLPALLRQHAEGDAYAFHMPGHKGLADPLGGLPAVSADITEIPGFDALHDADGILREEMLEAAALFQADRAFLLVNGSTCGILAAVSAAVPEGGKLLIERSSHLSVYHAAHLRKCRLCYIGEEAEAGCEAAVRNLIETERPDAVVLTSPSYTGIVKDTALWAREAHRSGAVLIVDAAHGAHFSMHPYFPESAIRLGADCAVAGMHKTLPAFTQTAVLLLSGQRVREERVSYYLSVYESSSPSYILMASAASAVHLLRDEGDRLFTAYAKRLSALREGLAGLRRYSLLGGRDAVLKEGELPPYPAGTRTDPGKLFIRAADPAGLEEALRTRYGLYTEMVTGDGVLAMTSAADTDEGFARLLAAMRELDAETESLPGAMEGSVLPLPPAVLSIAEAMERVCAEVPLKEAEGRVSGAFIVLFPPDVPVIVPGEVWTREVIETVLDAEARGIRVSGLRKEKAPVLSEAPF